MTTSTGSAAITSATTSGVTTTHPPRHTLPFPRSQTATPHLPPLGLATVLVGVLLPLIDFFIVNVALPTIERDLDASSAVLELVVSGYATAYAVLLVIGGRLGDTHGRRRMFLLGMGAFTVTSLLCGLAPTAGFLVAARVLQGAAAALMVPQVLSTIQATGEGRSRARALGLYGATAGIAAVTGQVLGGVLVAADIAGSSWRPIFLVNVPIGLVGLVFAARHVPETRAPRAAHLDGIGTTLLALTLVAVLVPLTEGRALHWPLWSWVLLGLAPVGLAAFVRAEHLIERRGRTPLVPPSLVRMPTMSRGLAIAAPFFGGFGAFMFVYALVAQQVLGWGPLRAGLALSPMAITFLLASLLSARAVATFGRRVIGAGAALQAVGLVGVTATLLASWPHVTALELLPSFAVMGFGQGLVLSPLFRVVLSDVPLTAAGAGSGVLTTTQQVALALGVATLGSLFVSLAGHGSDGARTGVLTVLGLQTAVAVVVSVASQRLPNPTR